MKKIFILAALALPLGAMTGVISDVQAAVAPSQQAEYKLWYDKPSEVWTDALPLGNGAIGAMVYGGVAQERICLNEETIWAGQPNRNANPHAPEALDKVRQLIYEGKNREARDLATSKIMSNTNWGMPYQPFGDLNISFPGHIDYSGYYRELSIDSAYAVVKYEVGGVKYCREVITNFDTNVLTVRLTADKPGSITFNANFSTPQQDALTTTESDAVVLSGVAGTHEKLKGKIRYQGRLSAVAKGGKTAYRDGVLSVSGADEAVIYVAIATNFVNFEDISGDEVSKVKGFLSKAKATSYQQARDAHEKIFHKYYDRNRLWLGNDGNASMPTDQRILNFEDNDDNFLIASYYAFGRYLLICCSQPGGQPANLQGIWNDKMLPSWDCKYTTNINLEMNYWPSEVCNLTELNGPLFQLIREVAETGHETARVMYGADGWVLHHNTDIWRVTGGIDNASAGMWQAGGAWLVSHLWQHYLYTGDKDFLAKAYPLMEGAARFFTQTLQKDPQHGYLVVCPSVSPENTPKGYSAPLMSGVTMDNQLVSELYNEVMMAANYPWQEPRDY